MEAPDTEATSRCAGAYSCANCTFIAITIDITCIGINSCHTLYSRSADYEYDYYQETDLTVHLYVILHAIATCCLCSYRINVFVLQFLVVFSLFFFTCNVIIIIYHMYHRYGPVAGSKMRIDALYPVIYAETSFALANDDLYFLLYPYYTSGQYPYVKIYLDVDYALWNVTLNCYYGINLYIECANENSNQFIITYRCWIYSYYTNCNIINNIAYIDNDIVQSAKETMSVIKKFETIYKSECNDNKSMVFDIGYPIYGESLIQNSDYGNAICCRGADSCAYSSTLFSNLGNILYPDFISAFGCYVLLCVSRLSNFCWC